jgi:hypothetical protein
MECFDRRPCLFRGSGIFLVFLFSALSICAQQTVTSGTLSGRMEAASGAVVSGASLTHARPLTFRGICKRKPKGRDSGNLCE